VTEQQRRDEHCQVVTTVDSREEAGELARTAVLARLAACAQVLAGPVTSTYWWQGAVESTEEWQVVFKTTLDRYPALEEHIRRHHDYEVPEILCVPVLAGNPGYLDWVSEQTRAAGAPGRPN
jgi:periplasmic divalent cation tolerance protein